VVGSAGAAPSCPPVATLTVGRHRISRLIRLSSMFAATIYFNTVGPRCMIR
jgi:hypothetical protein